MARKLFGAERAAAFRERRRVERHRPLERAGLARADDGRCEGAVGDDELAVERGKRALHHREGRAAVGREDPAEPETPAARRVRLEQERLGDASEQPGFAPVRRERHAELGDLGPRAPRRRVGGEEARRDPPRAAAGHTLG